MSKKLKILYLIPYFAPAWEYGGPVRVVYELSKRLIKNGHDVTICTTDVYSAKKRLEIRLDQPDFFENIKVFHFKNLSNFLAWNARLFYAPKMIRFLKKQLKNYDLIHIHDFFVSTNISAVNSAKKLKIPVLMSAHGSLGKEHLKQKPLIKNILNALGGKKMIKNASCLVALTNQEKKDYEALGAKAEQIEIIPNGIDFQTFSQKLPTEDFIKKYHFKNDEKIILYLGRIYPIKGTDLLVKAFAELAKENPSLKVKLLLVGPDVDNYFATLKKIAQEENIAEKIIFTGPLTGQEKIKAFQAASLFVLPSRGEGLPMSVLEACASGLPTVVSKDCHLPEIAQYKAGFVIKRRVNGIKKAMEKILVNSELAQKMSINAQRMVKEKFDWDKVVIDLEKIYYTLVKD